jgi:hypothetical protein
MMEGAVYVEGAIARDAGQALMVDEKNDKVHREWAGMLVDKKCRLHVTPNPCN